MSEQPKRSSGGSGALGDLCFGAFVATVAIGVAAGCVGWLIAAAHAGRVLGVPGVVAWIWLTIVLLVFGVARFS